MTLQEALDLLNKRGYTLVNGTLYPPPRSFGHGMSKGCLTCLAATAPEDLPLLMTGHGVLISHLAKHDHNVSSSRGDDWWGHWYGTTALPVIQELMEAGT